MKINLFFNDLIIRLRIYFKKLSDTETLIWGIPLLVCAFIWLLNSIDILSLKDIRIYIFPLTQIIVSIALFMTTYYLMESNNRVYELNRRKLFAEIYWIIKDEKNYLIISLTNLGIKNIAPICIKTVGGEIVYWFANKNGKTYDTQIKDVNKESLSCWLTENERKIERSDPLVKEQIELLGKIDSLYIEDVCDKKYEITLP